MSAVIDFFVLVGLLALVIDRLLGGLNVRQRQQTRAIVDEHSLAGLSRRVMTLVERRGGPADE